jgi:hypothetical protein
MPKVGGWKGSQGANMDVPVVTLCIMFFSSRTLKSLSQTQSTLLDNYH